MLQHRRISEGTVSLMRERRVSWWGVFVVCNPDCRSVCVCVHERESHSNPDQTCCMWRHPASSPPYPWRNRSMVTGCYRNARFLPSSSGITGCERNVACRWRPTPWRSFCSCVERAKSRYPCSVFICVCVWECRRSLSVALMMRCVCVYSSLPDRLTDEAPVQSAHV